MIHSYTHGMPIVQSKCLVGANCCIFLNNALEIAGKKRNIDKKSCKFEILFACVGRKLWCTIGAKDKFENLNCDLIMANLIF